MKLLTSIITLLCLATLPSCTDTVTEPPATGVPIELARQRAQSVSDVYYDLQLQVQATASEALLGELIDANYPLVLGFRTQADHVLAVSLDGGEVDYYLPAEHIVIPPSALSTGAHAIRIQFLTRLHGRAIT
jgi:hypothetical protein